jgi:hypothetical protein
MERHCCVSEQDFTSDYMSCIHDVFRAMIADGSEVCNRIASSGRASIYGNSMLALRKVMSTSLLEAERTSPFVHFVA